MFVIWESLYAHPVYIFYIYIYIHTHTHTHTYVHNNTLYGEMKGRQDCRASGFGFQMNSL